MVDNVVSASARGATFLILLQIGSRAITFALNQYLLRFLSPELLGVSVQLELYKMGTMYFARESLRVAAERRSDGGVQAAVNLSYLAIIAGLPIGAILAEWYLTMRVLNIAYFAEALRVNQLAAIVELLMEPAFTVVQQNLMYGSRAAAEGSSVILKTLTVFALFLWGNAKGLNLGVLPYAVGELVNSIVLTSVYWALTSPVAKEKKFSLFPKKMQTSPSHAYALSYFSKPLLWLIISLFFQTGIKWLLTEGDRLLILALASLEDQGLYALAANYGGLVARMIFQPIEVSSRNLFANFCAAPSQHNGGVRGSNSEHERDNRADRTKANLKSTADTLRDMLRFYNIASLIVFAIGPTAAPLMLHLLAGSQWSNSGAADVLGTYCYYIPFLAINGVSEAFVAATASTKDLRNQSFWMAGFSALFAASAYVFVGVLGMGAGGLVWANCLNMALRIVFNLRFVNAYFTERNVEWNALAILPSASAVAAAAITYGLVGRTPWFYTIRAHSALGELVIVACSGVVATAAIATAERHFLLRCYKTMNR